MSDIIHVWEKIELSFSAEKTYADSYNDVDVYVDLTGPGFSKRCYGFWDGGSIFKVRIVATTEGEWSWISGSNQDDPGLNGKTDSFTAVAWSEEECDENPTRRGFVRTTKNGHALEFADGTPYYMLGDTWWATPTWRFPWYDDDNPRPLTQEMGFKDMVKYRKAQGFNSVAIMACFPNWKEDDHPSRWIIDDEKKTMLRSGWDDPITGSSLDMHNEGGVAFLFPGIIPGHENDYPDVTKINPEYFKVLDKKIDYLNDQGFVPFLEAIRRDATQAWLNYYPWTDSYLRYVSYLFARYQANNLVLSPIHYDSASDGIHARYFNTVMSDYFEKYGRPPFGTLLSANAPSSSLPVFGGKEDAPWIDIHQIGNVREHEFYWYLTEIYNIDPPVPALHGEPYYSAWGLNVGYYKLRGKPNSPEDDRCVRNGMYGSFLSGGLAGYIYGTTGIVRAAREDGYLAKMWDGIKYTSANMIKPFSQFVFSEGDRYQELIPEAELVSPNKTHELYAFEGWAFAAGTREKDLFMIYYEKGCPSNVVRSVMPDGIYIAKWFDPRTGEWSDAGELTADMQGRISKLPKKPTDDDWCLKLNLVRKNDMKHSIPGPNPSTIFGLVSLSGEKRESSRSMLSLFRKAKSYEEVEAIQNEFLAGIDESGRIV